MNRINQRLAEHAANLASPSSQDAIAMQRALAMAARSANLSS
jgi:hypothetical protein